MAEKKSTYKPSADRIKEKNESAMDSLIKMYGKNPEKKASQKSGKK